jgi:hypothetical protein
MASEPFEVTDDKGNTVTGTIDVFRDPMVPTLIPEVNTTCILDTRMRISSISTRERLARLIATHSAGRCKMRLRKPNKVWNQGTSP